MTKLSTKTQILRFLVRNPGQPTNDIAWYLNKSPSTIRKYLKELREEGIVTRKTFWYGQLSYTWVYSVVTGKEEQES